MLGLRALRRTLWAGPEVLLAHPADPSATVVLLRDVRLDTVIGVHAKERRRPRALRLDMDIELPDSRAGRTDLIEDTIDYAAVVDDLRRAVGSKDYFLLERLAEFIAERVIRQFGAARVSLQIAKLGILRGVGRVGVRLERCAQPLHIASPPLPNSSSRSSGIS
jgi:dihydroneopterin aldolase